MKHEPGRLEDSERIIISNIHINLVFSEAALCQAKYPIISFTSITIIDIINMFDRKNSSHLGTS